MKAPLKIRYGPQRVVFERPDREWLLLHYLELGKTQKEIASEVGCHFGTVKRWVKEHALQKELDEYHYRYYEIPDESDLRHKYINLDLSIRDLADEYGCSTVIIQKWLKTYEMSKPKEQLAKKHSKRMSGKGNPAYRNGNSNRYVRRRLSKVKPKICEWCSATKDIQVHHIDHDTENNEPDNLAWLCGPCNRMEAQLWQLQQANRVRVQFEDNRLIIEFLGE